MSEIPESERLARRWFSIVEERAFDQLGELVDPSIVLVSKIRPGLVVEGRDEFVRYVQETLANSLYEAAVSSFQALNDERIVVEGRLRWIDDDRVIRDDPVTWAMEFRDGLLTRFVPARTLVEAETILTSPPAQCFPPHGVVTLTGSEPGDKPASELVARVQKVPGVEDVAAMLYVVNNDARD